MGKDDDVIIVSGSSDTMIDMSNYGAAQPTYTIGNIDTITLDSSTWNTGSITAANTLSWQQDYSINSWTNDPGVNINSDGITMKQESDLKIGNRSLKDFMDKVEDQLAILRPAPELEEKWDKLKELRRQYEECKQDILEKEKIMKILKEQ
jgi:hypothetical protein